MKEVNNMAARVSWQEELPKHPIFKQLSSVSGENYKERRSRHIFIEKDGEIFVWMSSKRQVLTANLKNLHFNNERAGKFQVSI